MKYTILTLFIFLSFQSCSFKIRIKERYFSNEEMIRYVKEKKYPFDYILKFNDASYFKNRHSYNINSINFMNFYSKDNKLLKSSDGENCEFKIASYIKDSMHQMVEHRNENFSLSNIVSKSEVIDLGSKQQVLSNNYYKIVVGWSINLNEFAMIKKRLDKLLNEIDFKTDNYILVGLNLDPLPETH